MPRAKEEALAIGRTVVSDGPQLHANPRAAEIRGALRAWMRPALVLGRSLVLVALAAFVILVLLPAMVAAQATLPA
jgi:hypothetical protein